MNPDANAEAISLTDEEREQLAEAGGTHVEKTVASILAARLAGAGAQVTEAALREAIAQEIDRIPTVDGANIDRDDTARIVRSAGLPHKATGQAEAWAAKYEELRDRAKNAATELGAKNDRLAAELSDLRARISALADEWHVILPDQLRALLDRPAAAGDESGQG